jgi:hypothetical protein
VLADALVHACELAPALVLDAATLTGAGRVALGTDIPAVFVNDDPLAAALAEVRAARGTGLRGTRAVLGTAESVSVSGAALTRSSGAGQREGGRPCLAPPALQGLRQQAQVQDRRHEQRAAPALSEKRRCRVTALHPRGGRR